MKTAIVRNTFHDRSAFLQLSLEYQKLADLSDTIKTFVFVDPHTVNGYVEDYDSVITDDLKRINFDNNVGKLSWYTAVKYIFDNYDYDHVISIEDDIIVSKDYLRMCFKIIEYSVLEKHDDILYFHIGAWEKPKGDKTKIVRSSASLRSALIGRDKFFKYVDKFYKENTEIRGFDLDLQDILNANNLTAIAPIYNRHGHFGVYGWSSNGIHGDDRGQNSIFESKISHEKLYNILKKSCLSKLKLLKLNNNMNPGYFWNFNPDIEFSEIEYNV